MIPTATPSHSLDECVIRPELIPDHVREDIGRVGLEAVIRYYQDPEHVRQYREWLATYERRQRKGDEQNGS